jgi:phytoene dehydrogenase-like protein
MSKRIKKVGIIGAGLSGLACALELKKCGHEVQVFEQSDSVGGRVKTDHQGGFTFDHGFQIYLTGYEKGQYYLDYKKLGLGTFSPGALIWNNSSFKLFSDPLRRPKHFFTVMLSPLANFRDKLLILKLKSVASQIDEEFEASKMTTLEYLKSFGFSYQIIDSFFKPFFAGVFLDTALDVDSNYFLYLFHKFSTSSATLPKFGIQAIAKQMADQLGAEKITLNTKITSVSGCELTINDKQHSFDHLVIATSKHEANVLRGIKEEVPYYVVTTHYYKTTSKEYAKRYLYLNSEEHCVVNHVACLSKAQKSYAPKGEHLYSVNVLNSPSDVENEDQVVRDDLVKIFGADEIEMWHWMRSYSVKHALNKDVSFGSKANKLEISLCGDYLESASIQGALTSGFKTAHNINLEEK